jgi:hypothetical protein
MTLFNSETVLSRIDDGQVELVLTTDRVVYGSKTKFTSIRLEDVGSAILLRLTHGWILAITGTCFTIATSIIAMAVQNDGIGALDFGRRLASALLFLSAYMVVAFGNKRFDMIQISSPEATIAFPIRSIFRKDVERLLCDLNKIRFAREPIRGGWAGQSVP